MDSKLLQQLDGIRPDWRLEYGDPLTAALDLCLISPEEVEDYQPLKFSDEDNWRRYYELAN